MITTVSIIEDDPKFGFLLKKIIESDNALVCVGIYQNLKSSLTELAEKTPDVMLLDIQLPDGLGSEYVDTLKKISPQTHFIMCTSFEDDDYIFESLKRGASGYLIKSESPEKIIESIKDVLEGGAPMSSTIARKVVSHFRVQTQQLENLTPKENELLAHLANGFFYKEIAIKMNIGIDTVKKHASSIYRKLHVNNRTEAVNKFKKN
jgi:two-component system, NarL family, response regulator LiaR